MWTCIIVLQHCIWTHVLEERNTHWSPDLVNVTLSIHVTVNNDQLRSYLCSYATPHRDAPSIECSLGTTHTHEQTAHPSYARLLTLPSFFSKQNVDSSENIMSPPPTGYDSIDFCDDIRQDGYVHVEHSCQAPELQTYRRRRTVCRLILFYFLFIHNIF